ncbi:hypothetical protein [Haloparvum alkalitolerans]|uniref:hypothetical protein n=1 Tax=Haloparvum alkalitolerans TaxID=1042953 RepID=UPI003CE9ECB3
MFIHSSFIKETIGIVFFALILYLLTLRLVPREDISREQWSLLATLGIGGVTISHHLAAAISLTLFSSLFISQYLPLSNEPTTRSIDITGFSILTSVIVVSFWIYVQQSPLLLTITELLTALQPTSSSTGTPIQIAGTPGSAFTYPWQDLWNIAWNSSFILGPIAGVGSILTSLLIPKRRCISSGLIAFGSLMAMFTLILTVFSSASSSGAAWGGRFVVYGLAALYLVSTALVPRMPRLPNAKVFAGVLLVSVLILQGFATPPSLYIDSEQPIDVDKHSYYSQPSEKVAVDWTTENSLGGNLIQIDIWLYERTVSLYESPIQDRMRRIQQCGRRDLPISVTSINALPNSPDCEFIDRSKVFDSGTTKVNIQ